MAADGRATTIRDVARAAGVSVASASRALNGHRNVADAMRLRVKEAAHALDYVPHLGARSLSTRQTGTIGVVLPDLFGEFFSEMIRGIDSAAHRQGLQLLLSNMHGDARETEVALRAMRGRVDGLIVMSPNVGPEFLTRHLPETLPAVVINGGAEGRSCIAVDSYAGARAAVAHLVERGARKLAHIAGPADNADAQERLRGFRDGAADLLGDADPIIFQGDFQDESGRTAGIALVRQRRGVDGVFAGNDMMAVGCLDALADGGVRVPGEMMMVGFDDVPIARYARPALTTMRVAIADLGRRAFERLQASIEAPGAAPAPTERVLPELIVRASTDRAIASDTNGTSNRHGRA